ncbi:MAG TPA: hypothetical protein VFI02_19510 [Armatimonadota bacterium]|nr:hypothetical protein [Armatimonadota bacterium]
MAEKKTCFIIMPITTPDHMLGVYRDGERHFKHVLECLFIPSVEKAGFEAIPPEAKGSDLIHAEIIGRLESSDLVLCDMSCLNPNVFFEFGIRTSLNKPVCVVKDEHTPKVPFDTSLLNHHEYSSTLGAWELEKEMETLAKHIATSAERSNGQNTLWKYFGLKSEAKSYEGESGAENKLDLIAMQLDSMQQRLGQMESMRRLSAETEVDIPLPKMIYDSIRGWVGPGNLEEVEITPSSVKVTLRRRIPPEGERALNAAALTRWGRIVEFRVKESPDPFDEDSQELPDPFADKES